MLFLYSCPQVKLTAEAHKYITKDNDVYKAENANLVVAKGNVGSLFEKRYKTIFKNTPIPIKLAINI